MIYLYIYIYIYTGNILYRAIVYVTEAVRTMSSPQVYIYLLIIWQPTRSGNGHAAKCQFFIAKLKKKSAAAKIRILQLPIFANYQK